MPSTKRNGLLAVLVGPWRADRAMSSAMERLDRIEDALADTNRRIDDLAASTAAIDAVRVDVRSLTASLTEELNQISADLGASHRS